ncbi:MAG: DMT family transporter [Gemmatimonadota bacterium]
MLTKTITATTTPQAAGRRTRLAGYAFALCAGAIWGTTGPLSTAIYAEGGQLNAWTIGFWRILLATLGFIVYGFFARDLFRVDRRGLLLVGVVGGLLVAIFEVAFQFAIAGLGIAPAVVLLYTAPVAVAFLAHAILGEKLTMLRVLLAVVVLVGVTLSVNGKVETDAALAEGTSPETVARWLALAAGILTAASFAGTTILARFAVPRYGVAKVLFLEIAGGTVILALLLPLLGHAPRLPASVAGWIYIAALGIGSVLAANFFFFAAVKRIDAAPTAVAASIEPFVGAMLALLLFDQQLHWFGWLGLAMVIAGVAGGAGEEVSD